MRSRRAIWVVLSLLCVTGLLLIWRTESRNSHANRHPLSQPAFTAMHSTSSAPALAQKALSQKAALLAEAKTNRFAYRLSNTDKTLEQLMHDRHAILLENALIDVSKPVNLEFPKQLQAKGDPGAYIVQSRGLNSAMFRAMLTGSGARIISYIPNNAYLVEAPSGIASALADSAAVQSVLPYEPYYKIQYTLLGAAVDQTMLPPDAKLTLGLFPDNAAQTIAQIQSLGAQVVGQDSSPFGPIVRVTAPPELDGAG